MTVHSAKGLEFPYVFLPGFEDGLFPSSRAAVEYGNAKGVKAPPQSDIVFNSPIVLYTHKAVADGLVNGGLVTKDNSGAYHMCLIWP